MEEDLVLKGEPIYYAHTLSVRFKSLNLIPISDAHYGNPLFSERHFLRTIQMLAAPNTYAVLNGDMIEAVIKTSKGDIFTQMVTPKDQAKWIAKKLMPYRKKILGATMGNHEKRIYDAVGDDYSEFIAEQLGIPYRAEGLLIKISFGHNHYGRGISTDRPYTYWIYLTHGYGGARTKAAKAVKVERIATWIDADAYIMSHDHVVNVAPDVYLVPDPRTKPEIDKEGNLTGFTVGKVTAHRKMLVKSNAYLKWGGYSEFGGFPPVDLETPIIKLAGEGKPRVRVEV